MSPSSLHRWASTYPFLSLHSAVRLGSEKLAIESWSQWDYENYHSRCRRVEFDLEDEYFMPRSVVPLLVHFDSSDIDLGATPEQANGSTSLKPISHFHLAG